MRSHFVSQCACEKRLRIGCAECRIKKHLADRAPRLSTICGLEKERELPPSVHVGTSSPYLVWAEAWTRQTLFLGYKRAIHFPIVQKKLEKLCGWSRRNGNERRIVCHANDFLPWRRLELQQSKKNSKINERRFNRKNWGLKNLAAVKLRTGGTDVWKMVSGYLKRVN